MFTAICQDLTLSKRSFVQKRIRIAAILTLSSKLVVQQTILRLLY